MILKTGRMALLLGAAVQLLVVLPYAGDAHAQHRDGYRGEWSHGYAQRERESGNDASGNGTAATTPRPRASW